MVYLFKKRYHQHLIRMSEPHRFFQTIQNHTEIPVEEDGEDLNNWYKYYSDAKEKKLNDHYQNIDIMKKKCDYCNKIGFSIE